MSDYGVYRAAARKIRSAGDMLVGQSPPVNAGRAEHIMLTVSAVRQQLDIIAQECAKQIVDSEVEPGPEGRAAIISESEGNGVRTIIAGPKSTERNEVVS